MTPTPQFAHCPRCRHARWAGESSCPNCDAPIHGHSADTAASPPRQFRLRRAMVGIALLAAAFGLIRAAPVLGIPLVMVAAPTVIRTRLAAGRRRAEGRVVTLEDRFELIGQSLYVVLLAAVAGGNTLFWIAVPLAFVRRNSPSRNTDFAIAIAVGVAAAVLVTALILRRHWPDRG